MDQFSTQCISSVISGDAKQVLCKLGSNFKLQLSLGAVMILFEQGGEKRKSQIYLVIFCSYWLTFEQLLDQCQITVGDEN